MQNVSYFTYFGDKYFLQMSCFIEIAYKNLFKSMFSRTLLRNSMGSAEPMEPMLTQPMLRYLNFSKVILNRVYKINIDIFSLGYTCWITTNFLKVVKSPTHCVFFLFQMPLEEGISLSLDIFIAFHSKSGARNIDYQTLCPAFRVTQPTSKADLANQSWIKQNQLCRIFYDQLAEIWASLWTHYRTKDRQTDMEFEIVIQSSQSFLTGFHWVH